MRRNHRLNECSGVSLAETLVAISISVFAISSIYIGSVTLQKSFRASQHYAATQAAQLRVIDYVALDLRRGVKWQAQNGGTELTVWIPNYYSGDVEDRSQPRPSPRYPKVSSNGGVYYGDTENDLVKVRYYTPQRTDTQGLRVKDVRREVTRNGKTKETLLVTGALDFEPLFDEDADTKGQVVHTRISFPPAFRPFINSGNAYRDGTTTFATTLARNKR